VTALFADTLKVVVEHRDEYGVVFVAGYEYLLYVGQIFAHRLDSRRGKNTRACTGIENSVNALGFIEGEHICHKTGGILFSEKTTESYIFGF
jgi:hypothetical protein